MHPDADVGLEAWESNVHELNRPGVVGDARWLPFENDSFDGIIGRRFLHHVPEEDRRKILDETSRVTKSGGKVILLEGTPGIYRKLTKGLAFRLGILEEDNDIYGHISGSDLRELVGEELEVIANRSLGSPLMPASILGSDFSEKIFHLYTSTQFIKWWTLVVGEKSDRQHQKR
jgi:SAM-dependent methyltransferase